jgi:hypothetical protein
MNELPLKCVRQVCEKGKMYWFEREGDDPDLIFAIPDNWQIYDLYFVKADGSQPEQSGFDWARRVFPEVEEMVGEPVGEEEEIEGWVTATDFEYCLDVEGKIIMLPKRVAPPEEEAPPETLDIIRKPFFISKRLGRAIQIKEIQEFSLHEDGAKVLLKGPLIVVTEKQIYESGARMLYLMRREADALWALLCRIGYEA